jgi:hypothetical protein
MVTMRHSHQSGIDNPADHPPPNTTPHIAPQCWITPPAPQHEGKWLIDLLMHDFVGCVHTPDASKTFVQLNIYLQDPIFKLQQRAHVARSIKCMRI